MIFQGVYFVKETTHEITGVWASIICNTTGATSGAGVAYPSGAPELTLVFLGFVLLQL